MSQSPEFNVEDELSSTQDDGLEMSIVDHIDEQASLFSNDSVTSAVDHDENQATLSSQDSDESKQVEDEILTVSQDQQVHSSSTSSLVESGNKKAGDSSRDAVRPSATNSSFSKNQDQQVPSSTEPPSVKHRDQEAQSSANNDKHEELRFMNDMSLPVEDRYVKMIALYGYAINEEKVDLAAVEHDTTLRPLSEDFVSVLLAEMNKDCEEALKGMTRTPFLLYRGEEGRLFLIDGNHRRAAIVRYLEAHQQVDRRLFFVKAMILNKKPSRGEFSLFSNRTSWFETKHKKQWSFIECLEQSYDFLTGPLYAHLDGAKSLSDLAMLGPRQLLYTPSESKAIYQSLLDLFRCARENVIQNTASFVHLTRPDFDLLISTLKKAKQPLSNKVIWEKFIGRYREAPKSSMKTIIKAFPPDATLTCSEVIDMLGSELKGVKEAWPIFRDYHLYEGDMLSYEETLRQIVKGKETESLQDCEDRFVKFCQKGTWKTNINKKMMESVAHRVKWLKDLYAGSVEKAKAIKASTQKKEKENMEKVIVEENPRAIKRSATEEDRDEEEEEAVPKKKLKKCCKGCAIHDTTFINKHISPWVKSDRRYVAALAIYTSQTTCKGIEKIYPWYRRYVDKNGVFLENRVPKETNENSEEE